MVNTGVASALTAELRALWTGLTEARRQGFLELVIETDSMTVVELVTGEEGGNARYNPLVNERPIGTARGQ